MGTRCALLVINGVTLAEISPLRERLTALGARVTAVVPSGSPLLPVSGRYFPAANGKGERCALSEVNAADFDVLILPDSVTAAELLRYPLVARLIQGNGGETPSSPVIAFSARYVLHLLERHIPLSGLAQSGDALLTVH